MKKYIILFLVLLFIVILITNNIYANNYYPLLGKIIVIDPGHGNLDPGCIYGNIYEKNITLKISLYIKDEIERLGGNTILTRDDDYDLSSPNALFRKKSDFDNRIKIINNSNADIYLSIHLNYLNDSTYYGPQVFYLDDSKVLAQKMQNILNNKLNSDRKIKIIPNDTYMYRKLNIKGLLIECGFLSNKSEREKLITDDYDKLLAKYIVSGLITYFSS